MKTFKKIIIAAFFVTITLPSMAWGVLGHRIVGQVADSYLTPKAKLEIQKILGTESIAMASNWPDFIKSDPKYKYLSTWHYVNLMPGLTEDSLKKYLAADTATDAFTKTNFIVNELKKNKLIPIETKQLYVRLLIHIIGDLHQPMHVGREEDRGGNALKVKWFSEETNMHVVWDEKLISFQQLSYTEYAAAINFPTAKQKLDWKKFTLQDWIYDSYKFAEEVYADYKPDTRLGFEYNFKFVGQMNEQLLKGGLHLANVFNDIYK
jgi:S1/P1 Nuclease